MTSLADDWDAIPVSGSTAPASEAKSLADEWDAIPVDNKTSELSTGAEDKKQSFFDKAKIVYGALNPKGEAAIRLATGAASSIPSQIAGLITGDKELTEDIQDRGTYQPVSETGKKISSIIESQYSPLMWPGMATAKLGELTGSQRIESAANIGLMGVGVRAAKGKAPVESPWKAPDAQNKPSIIERVEPTQDFLVGEKFLESPEKLDSFINEKIEKASPEIVSQFLEAEKSGLFADKPTLARHLEADSLPVPVKLTEGQASQNVNLLSNEQNMRGKHGELAQIFNDQNGLLIDNINAIRDKAAPDVTGANHVDNGKSLIDSYKAIDDARQSEVNAAYKELSDANGGSIPIDGKAFASDVQSKLGTGKLVSQEKFLPDSVKRIVDDISNSEQAMTMDDFVNLRKILSKEVNKASRSGDGNAVGAINAVRESLENIPMGESASSLKPLADKAKDTARKLFKDRDADPAWKAAADDSVYADDFVKTFVVNGKVENLARMKENLKGDPIAEQNIKSGAINYLKDRAGIDRENGNFNQSSYNKGLKGMAPKMQYIFDPETANYLNTLGNVARNTQFQPRGSFVNNSNTMTSYLASKGASAAEAALSAKTFGASKLVGDIFKERSAKKTVEKAVSPAAGSFKKLSDIGKD